MLDGPDLSTLSIPADHCSLPLRGDGLLSVWLHRPRVIVRISILTSYVVFRASRRTRNWHLASPRHGSARCLKCAYDVSSGRCLSAITRLCTS